MSSVTECFANKISARGVLLGFWLVSAISCSHHQPAPVIDHSKTPLKRSLNSDGTYVVQRGDTLYAIAFNFNVDARLLAKWNKIYSPYVIYPGQKLRLSASPSGKRTHVGSPGVKISTRRTPGSATVRNKGRSTKRTPVKPKSTTSTGSKPSSTVPRSADPSSWKWPTDGRVVRSYVAGDPARNGLDISGREGQDIKATSKGQVVYSGNGLIGYGELVIIKHSERMLSAYAHNRVRLVQEGDMVSSGQKIAEMGRNTGNKQLLHFEIRVLGKPVNPLNCLPKR